MCGNQEDCKLNLEVFSLSSENHRFSLTYSIDQVPIVLKEGVTVTLPDNYPQYFLYEEKKGEPVSFDVVSNEVKMVAYA